MRAVFGAVLVVLTLVSCQREETAATGDVPPTSAASPKDAALALERRARALYQSGDLSAALPLTRRACQLAPRFTASRALLARLLSALDRHAEALELLDDTAHDQDRAWEIQRRYQRALTLRALDRHDAARDEFAAFDRARRAHDRMSHFERQAYARDDAPAWLALAAQQLREGRLPSAERSLASAERLDPHGDDLLAARALIALERDGLAALDPLLESDADWLDSAGGRLLLARSLHLRGELARALETLRSLEDATIGESVFEEDLWTFAEKLRAKLSTEARSSE